MRYKRYSCVIFVSRCQFAIDENLRRNNTKPSLSGVYHFRRGPCFSLWSHET